MPARHPSIARALGVVRQALRPLEPLREGGRSLRVLVACSGGPDSMALLGLLELLAHGERLQLCVGHVDHGLRAGSAEEAALVLEVARARGMPAAATRLDLAPGSGLPARAREARRAALLAQCASLKARVIALGHTATDQAETVLLHLARGAGLDGLSGMPPYTGWPSDPKTPIWVRPMLGLTREQTRRLAQRLELPFVDDPTNEDTRAPRIVMRARVLPIFRELNPAAELGLAALADRVRQADAALAEWIDREVTRRTLDPSSEGAPRFSVEGIAALPEAIRRGFVRAICMSAGIPADALGRRLLDSIDAALLERGAPHGWDLHGGRQLRLRQKVLWLEAVRSDDET